jgi:ribosomal protein S18 acetylase RimI-like enzyme
MSRENRSDPEIRVEVVHEATDDLVHDLRLLLAQLSASAPPPGRAELARLLACAATALLVARDGSGRLVGTLTLLVYPTLPRVRARIEDVVVDRSMRRRGVATRLLRAAIDLAVERDARRIDLSSTPAREAANRLYPALGFERHETNVYRLTVRGEPEP